MTGRENESEAGLNGENAADKFFRADAEARGYLAEGGAGLWAYYREHGLLPPEVLERVIPKKESNGATFDFVSNRGRPDGGPKRRTQVIDPEDPRFRRIWTDSE